MRGRSAVSGQKNPPRTWMGDALSECVEAALAAAVSKLDTSKLKKVEVIVTQPRGVPAGESDGRRSQSAARWWPRQRLAWSARPVLLAFAQAAAAAAAPRAAAAAAAAGALASAQCSRDTESVPSRNQARSLASGSSCSASGGRGAFVRSRGASSAASFDDGFARLASSEQRAGSARSARSERRSGWHGASTLPQRLRPPIQRCLLSC